MGSLALDGATCESMKSTLNHKGAVVESALQQCLVNFREMLFELNQVQAEFETYRADLLSQKEKCESQQCSSSEILKKIIESKDVIIQLAVSAVIRLNETKNLNNINEILKILCGEVSTLTPQKDPQIFYGTTLNNNPQTNTPTKRIKKKLLSPKKELDNSIEDISLKDESVTEIDGTPGRTSPIIHPKKLKSSSSVSLSGNSTDSREKKKCPANWLTPESKQIKLSYTKSCGRSRQSKLFFTGTKAASIVDLTSSPELLGRASIQNESEDFSKMEMNSHPHVQLLIKKESSDNDDTILPSPTSSCGPHNFVVSKATTKEASKFKKPLSLSRPKTEPEEANSPIIQIVEPKVKEFLKDDLEESINILQTKRFIKSPHKASPRKNLITNKLQIKAEQSVKTEPVTQESAIKLQPAIKPDDEDMTHCEDASMSILQEVGKSGAKCCPKEPLRENVNATNVPQEVQVVSLKTVQDVQRKLIENVEPLYKEPTVRKKAEKMALPGWCCDECKAFFGDLYADDPEKIKAAIERCSKHRGRNNPVRPKTPPGYWDPRWEVPKDTEEFNRRNNAD